MTRELASELRRAVLAERCDDVERAGLVEQILQRDAARRVTRRLADRQLDLDLFRIALVAIGAHVSERGAREDACAVELDEPFDAESFVRLATDPQYIIDRHRRDR